MNSVTEILRLLESQTLTYEELVTNFSQIFINKNGKAKYMKIYKKVRTSSKVSNFIYKSLQWQAVPAPFDYLGCLNEIPYFIFARLETTALAAIISLERWNAEVNSKLILCDDQKLRELAERILRQSSVT
jgi:hypothetical protein